MEMDSRWKIAEKVRELASEVNNAGCGEFYNEYDLLREVADVINSGDSKRLYLELKRAKLTKQLAELDNN